MSLAVSNPRSEVIHHRGHGERGEVLATKRQENEQKWGEQEDARRGDEYG
jgi:hypothetical protein